jgi:hypothetical protein
MPEPKKAAESAPAPAKQLASAGESGDPSVHQILAELETARSNGNDEAVKALTDKLAALGYQ